MLRSRRVCAAIESSMISNKKVAIVALLLIVIGLVYFLFLFPSRETGKSDISSSSKLKEPYPVLDDADFWQRFENALKADDVQEVERLIDGVDIKVSKPDGSNLLHHAVFEEAYRVVELLLEKGMDPSVAASEGSTPLLHAALIEDVGLARILIEKGAVVNYFNDGGFTPLMAACLQDKSSSDFIVFLYENGADINAVSPEDATIYPNATALEIAIAMNNIQAFDTLLDLGAEIRVDLPAGLWTVMKWANYHKAALKDDSYLRLLEARLGPERFREIMSLESSAWSPPH